MVCARPARRRQSATLDLNLTASAAAAPPPLPTPLPRSRSPCDICARAYLAVPHLRRNLQLDASLAHKLSLVLSAYETRVLRTENDFRHRLQQAVRACGEPRRG